MATRGAPVVASTGRGRRWAALVLVAALLVAGQAAFGQRAYARTVKVQRGDSLWAISKRFGVNLGKLASVNHMRLTDVLVAGRTVTLPRAAVTSPDDGPGGATTATTIDPHLLERTFCSTYRPPTGPHRLPAKLLADPTRLALRPVFAKWAKAYGVPRDLLEAEAWQESGWSNSAVSPDHARGIGQLLPQTAAFVNQAMGTKLKLDVPSDNIQMMASFLGSLLKANQGKVCPAVAAYYQGQVALDRHGVLPVSQIYVRDVLSLRPRFR